MNQPIFSVVIPTFNRQEVLRKCLYALAQQSCPKSDFEIIVVDDGSIPPIPDSIVAELQDIGISLIRNSKNLGPSAARNRGAEAARGQYLAFTDDDCAPDRNWLNELKNVFAHDSAAAVGGCILAGSKNLYAKTSHAILDAAYEYYNETDARFCASANLTVPLKGYREVGGFLPEFRASEDREFCARWLRKGHRLLYAPQAVVVHQSHATMGSFLRCHYGYGKGAYKFRALQAKTSNRRLRLEPLDFYLRLMLFALSKHGKFRGIGIFLLTGLSQIASLLGFLVEKRNTKRARI